MKLSFRTATNADATPISLLRNAVSKHLTDEYRRGPWTAGVTEKGVLYGMRTSRVLVARNGGEIVATLSLATKKPWAIDPAYFTKVQKPLYLTAMTVTPDRQRTGIGRRLLDEAVAVARAWPSDAIRLDAFDADAGAGAFYAKYGFREVGRVTYRKAPLIYFELMLGGHQRLGCDCHFESFGVRWLGRFESACTGRDACATRSS